MSNVNELIIRGCYDLNDILRVSQRLDQVLHLLELAENSEGKIEFFPRYDRSYFHTMLEGKEEMPWLDPAFEELSRTTDPQVIKELIKTLVKICEEKKEEEKLKNQFIYSDGQAKDGLTAEQEFELLKFSRIHINEEMLMEGDRDKKNQIASRIAKTNYDTIKLKEFISNFSVTNKEIEMNAKYYEQMSELSEEIKLQLGVLKSMNESKINSRQLKTEKMKFRSIISDLMIRIYRKVKDSGDIEEFLNPGKPYKSYNDFIATVEDITEFKMNMVRSEIKLANKIREVKDVVRLVNNLDQMQYVRNHFGDRLTDEDKDMIKHRISLNMLRDKPEPRNENYVKRGTNYVGKGKQKNETKAIPRKNGNERDSVEDQTSEEYEDDEFTDRTLEMYEDIYGHGILELESEDDKLKNTLEEEQGIVRTGDVKMIEPEWYEVLKNHSSTSIDDDEEEETEEEADEDEVGLDDDTLDKNIKEYQEL